MELEDYRPVCENSVKEFFLSYVDALELPIIDYVAIGFQNTLCKKSTSIMLNLEWQKLFQEMQFAIHDPVRKASLNTKNKFFTFDDLDYQDSCGKEVMRQRKLHQIENGIVVVEKGLGENFMMTLGTGFKNFEARKFYLRHQSAIYRILKDLKLIIEPCTKEYKIKSLPVSADAK